MNKTLAAALETYKPIIAADYAARVTHLFSRMVADLGPCLKGISNSWTWAKVFNGTISPVVTWEGGSRIHNTASASIDAERLAKVADTYAAQAIMNWADKIDAKMGELDDAIVENMDGVAFRITGSRTGRKVVIEQQMIVNVSSQGTPFNQFPSRIYVNDKFHSEAAYKRLFAKEA